MDISYSESLTCAIRAIFLILTVGVYCSTGCTTLKSKATKEAKPHLFAGKDKPGPIIDLFGEEDHKEMVANENRLLRRRRRRHAEVVRRAEEADYWRKRAGWFDDDASMKDYNNGVYDAYYQVDDDGSGSKRNAAASAEGGDNAEMVKLGLKVGSVVVALSLCVIMYRAIARRMTGEKKSGGRSASRDRRSASRSRKGEDDYDLMDSNDDDKSRKSSRSKSKGRSRSKGRSASRTRSRSRSKARTGNKTPVLEPEDIPEPVLV
jgi:hypothetical protein